MGKAALGQKANATKKNGRRDDSAERITRAFDRAVIDYVEGRATLDQLARRTAMHSDRESIASLQRVGYGRVIVLLDAIGTILDDPSATSAPPGRHVPYFQKDLEAYYESLQSGKTRSKKR